MSRKMKPCPNCGRKNLTAFKTCYPKRFKKWYLECDHCHYCGKRAVFRFIAEIKWNKEKRNDKAKQRTV